MVRKLGQCMPKVTVISSMTARSSRIREQIQYMLDHAVIGKFVGMQPSEKSMVSWINSKWKTKGHYNLKLGSKGFRTISFIIFEEAIH